VTATVGSAIMRQSEGLALANKDFKDLLRDAMAAANIAPPTLAKELKVSRQTVYKWLSGQLPSHRHARALDARLGLSTFQVSNVKPLPSTGVANRIPIIEGEPASAAGTSIVKPRPSGWLEADDEISPQAIAFRMGGNSMEPEFYNGEIIIVDPQVEACDGDYVLVEILEKPQDEGHSLWTFKQYRDRGRHRGERVYDLVPLSPSCKTITIGPDTPGRIVGTMVEHRRRRPT
jgi:SOS-response transcriptional repressor LexA